MESPGALALRAWISIPARCNLLTAGSSSLAGWSWSESSSKAVGLDLGGNGMYKVYFVLEPEASRGRAGWPSSQPVMWRRDLADNHASGVAISKSVPLAVAKLLLSS
jgi:hypothetical protein